MLVSGVQQSDLVIHIYVCIYFFWILFHYGLLQDIDYGSRKTSDAGNMRGHDRPCFPKPQFRSLNFP